MSDETSSDAKPVGGAALPIQAPPWLSATKADLVDLDFEAPIAGSTAADSGELSDQFRAAMHPADNTAQTGDTPANRVFIMLSAITGMHFKPEERNEPFGPMITFADGRRSAVASDFRGAHVDLLAEMAKCAKNPVLRARLADVCWLLDRKRANLGSLAITSYVEIVQKMEHGELKFRFNKEGGPLQQGTRNYLRRALQIGRGIGWDKAEAVVARDAVTRLRKKANALRALAPTLWFGELDLDFGVSDPAEVATSIDEVLMSPEIVAAQPDSVNSFIAIELWQLAARAYHLAKRDDDKYRCQSAAAERLVSDAETALTRKNSALLASHILSMAIAQMHGLPGKKDRRTELRHRLIDIQARVPEEMSSFSQELDLREIAEKVQNDIERVGLLDKLFIFAGLTHSPDPDALAKSAVELIQKHPLASIFPTSHLDDEGKVIHRSHGGGLGDDTNNSAVKNQIAQLELVRRQRTSFGGIEAARRSILERHFLSDDIFKSLLQHSPFIPPDLIATFCRGFLRFFQGDFVSAIYILTPLLENSLRYVLKAHGHDVTMFDDATQTQQDRTISVLFEQMRTELDDIFTSAITTDIENVFLSKPGPQLRHSLSHGLFHDGTPYGADAIYGCWLIFRLCLLPLYPHREELQLTFE